MKKYYYAKEITCPDCDGIGEYLMSHPKYLCDMGEEYVQTCDTCKGKGYVHDEIDPITGFTIIEVQEGM